MSSQAIPRPSIGPAVTAAGNPQSCAVCRRALPIGAVKDSEAAATWECDHCGTSVTGVFLRAAANLSERVRFAAMHFDTCHAEPLPQSLRELVAQFLERRRLKQDIHGRRRNPRVPCDLDAAIVELDDRWLPVGGPTNAVVIDLASHGLGMMTAVPIRATQLAIQIACRSGLVQLIGRSVWSNQVGDSFQNSGVEFIVRLGRTAVPEHDLIG